MTTPRHDRAAATRGGLVAFFDREDLEEEAILAAVRDRLVLCDDDPSRAEAICDRAMGGSRADIKFVRGVALPAPRGRLTMPVQNLSRSRGRTNATRTSAGIGRLRQGMRWRLRLNGE